MPPELAQENQAHSESQPETLDVSAVAADISSDLFGQGEGSGASADSSGEPAGAPEAADTSVVAPPAQSPEGENAAEVQAIGAPSTWTKEALQEWASIPPRAQQEILKREEDALRGITQYKERAEVGDKYSEVVAPYRPLLEKAQVDPVQLFQSFAANHYLLSMGSPEQKLELAANLISGYGIDLGKLNEFIGNRVIEPVDPKIAELESRLARFESEAQSRQQSQQTEVQNQLLAEVDAMAKDPAYPHFEELLDDMTAIFKAGQANNLKEAYEKAVYLNPKTREKAIAAMTSNGKPQNDSTARDEKGRFTAADVNIAPKSKDGTVPVGSIDDTLEETMNKIKARG